MVNTGYKVVHHETRDLKSMKRDFDGCLLVGRAVQKYHIKFD